jgi:putative copper export protein
MLCLAAFNRLRLVKMIPQNEEHSSVERSIKALWWLRRNTALEIALGMAIIYIVGVLGVTPAGHVH